jgi:hypothetical protein
MDPSALVLDQMQSASPGASALGKRDLIEEPQP